MDLFTYLMAKKGHNTHRDLFSYLLGKNAGGSGTYTTFSGTSLNISNTLQAKIKNIALEGNTSQDGTPTPDTPIPIKIVTGEQNLTIQNKNLLPFNNQTFSIQGINFYCQNGKMYMNGSTKAEISSGHSSYKNNFKFTLPAGTYTFSLYLSQANSSRIVTSSGTTLAILTGTETQHKATFTLEKTEECYLGIYIYKQSYNNVLFDAQLEPGNEATERIGHEEQTYPLSLSNIELAKIENYKDYIFKNVTGSPYYNAELELNSWYKYNAIRKRIFDGSEDWGFQNSSNTPTPRTVLKLNIGNYIAGKYYSNYFIYDNQTSNRIVINNMPTLYLSLDNTVANIEGSDGNSTRVQKIKSWLSTHNTIIIYPLATPTYEKITNTTLIQQLENINNARSYKDTTIIECTSASTDNETIGFSGEIKVTSVGLGNSLNTSLLSSNLQEETNTNDIQEEPNLDEIEEHNDEPIENEVS